MENERTERDNDEPRGGAAQQSQSEAGGFHGIINRSYDDYGSRADPYAHANEDLQRNLDVSTDSLPYNTRHAADPQSAPRPPPAHQEYDTGSDACRASEGGVTEGDFVIVDLNHTGELANDIVDDSLDSVILEERRFGVGGGEDSYAGGSLSGMENDAYSYDGDAETDLSYGPPSADPGLEPPVLRNPDLFPVLERPVSGRYHKNPNLERTKAPVAPGPFDPHVGVFLAPPLATTKSSPAPSPRKRLPRPPSRLKMRCALGWSCLACLIGSFLCAIPALRYYVTANESRKIGDYNSAHSFLRKTALLAAVALALGVGAWVVLILFLSDSL